ncbi:MAG: hypothetical protein GQ569_05865 [Methylococcaceae bacterium]|nr:hypothetical protein [Methylococcaceae bacterium]
MYLEIVKRLEIIKNAVAIEEDELIEMQLNKLKSFELSEDVQKIVDLLESKRFENVPQLIDQYKQDRSGVIIYEDEAVQALKYELKVLENTLSVLTNEKNEYERQLHEFNAEYILHLGKIIEQILCLRYRHYADIVDEYPEFSSEAEEAEQAYESFKENSEQQLQDLPNTLNTEEKKELKDLYRKASRLSHPDVVNDEFKQQGEEVFKALNEAYRQQNLTRVKEILLHLETGQSFGIASDTVNDKEVLRKRIDLLREHLEQIEIDISSIKEDGTFKTLQNIPDWNDYFADLKQKLTQELSQLQQN